MSFQAKAKTFASALCEIARELPLAEQFDPNSVQRRALTNLHERIAEAVQLFGTADKEGAMAEAFATVKNEGAAEGKQAAMAEVAEKYVLKTDHEAALQGAAAEGIKQGRAAAEQDLAAKMAATAERAKLVTEAKLPQVMADKVSDDALASAAAESTRAKLAARARQLAEIGFNPDDHAEHFAAAAEALTEDGDTAFAAKVKLVKDAQEAAKKAAKAGAAAEATVKKTPVGHPMAGGTGGAGSGDKKTFHSFA